jgi:tetratricopeptide (TPR) repeat protein
VVFRHVGLAYGAVTRPAVKAGSFRLYKAVRETHAVENMSDTASDFLRVEFKTEPAKDQNTLRGKYFREDFASGENIRKVQFENEQVRITRLVCSVGKGCLEVANASEPVLFVAFNKTQFRSDGSRTIELSPGQTHWIAAGKSVAIDNIGETAAELLRFDFKTPPMKTPEAEKHHDHAHEENTAKAKANAEASVYLKRGAELERQGRIAESIAAHEQSLKIDAGLVQAHVNLISLYGRTNQFEKAALAFRKASEINPDIPELHFNFGVLLAGQQRMPEAANAFQRCLQLNPHYAEAHFNYGAIIETDGKLNEAAAHFRKAIENKSGYTDAHFHLGRILVNQNKLSEAIEQFQKSLTPENETTSRNLYALGATYLRAGDKTKAIQNLREALKLAKARNQIELANSLERDLKSLEQDK